MSNWSGASRSNYVKVADMAGLVEFLKTVSVRISPNEAGLVAFFPDGTEDGDWPTFVNVSDEDEEELEGEEDSEVAFSFETHIMPFIEEGQVLVIKSAGAERARYVSGHSSAFIRNGTEVKAVHLSLDDIYKKAAESFGVDEAAMTDCSY